MSWSAMIMGLAIILMAMHADLALKLFRKMENKPNVVTFIGVLDRCLVINRLNNEGLTVSKEILDSTSRSRSRDSGLGRKDLTHPTTTLLHG
ncbi:hypothetical protein Syun_000618 [Stephania yunnanensis]|uniref:Pentatricopeptide repeat-containing protein n=1 Tax=Stephania yunnanensis TaxID=152371 RepID=A0AAP0LCB2_9MAGN